MKDRWLAYVPALLLAVLAALTYWLDEQVQPEARHENSATNPDFLVENFVTVRMNSEGKPRYAVQAKRLAHYPGDNSTMLDHPQLTHYDPQTAPVTIRANQGLLSNNGENAYFTGDVLVRRQAHGEQPELSLETSYLHVIPDQDLAKTDREVTLRRGNSTLRSVGLEFNHATRSLKLLSQVRGSFETPAKDHRPAMPWERQR